MFLASSKYTNRLWYKTFLIVFSTFGPIVRVESHASRILCCAHIPRKFLFASRLLDRVSLYLGERGGGRFPLWPGI